MKKTLLRLTSTILSLIIALASFSFLTSPRINALPVTDIQTLLNAKMTQSGFIPGKAPPSSYEQYASCYGFVNALCKYLFGHGIPSQGNNVYTISPSSYLTQVGSTLTIAAGNLNATTIKSLFSQAQPGDIIQMDYTKADKESTDSRHTMMVYSVSGTGVTCYHAGSSKVYFGGMWSVDGTEMKWSTFTKYLKSSDDGISVYRSKVVSGADTTPPVIRDVVVSDISKNGYTVSCTVTDATGNLNRVEFPTWTEYNGQDDLSNPWPRGSANGNRYTFRVNVSDHNNELGTYNTHIYAFDNSGNHAFYSLRQVLESGVPTISNVYVSDVSSSGYTVHCTVTDNESGIDRVEFPTWTDFNWQDDLANPWPRGSANGNEYTFRVNTSAHHNEIGLYNTHIYAFDKCSNISMVALQQVIPNLPTPSNLRAVSVGKNKVTILWNSVSGAEGYLVYASKNGKYGYVGVTSGTAFTDSKALDIQYNYYWVFPYVKDKVTGMTVVGQCTKYVYAKGVTKAVTNLKANGTAGKVTLTWTASTGADGYLIYGIRPGGEYGYIGMTTQGTSYVDTKASKSNWTYYWVYPYHKNGDKMVVGGTAKYVYSKAR